MPWPSSGLINPRNERIYLRQKTWFEHILRGHPELTNCLGDVILTIREPEAIYLDSVKRSFRCFKFCEMSGIWIMIVYAVHRKRGRVKTAYKVINPWNETQHLNKVWPILPS